MITHTRRRLLALLLLTTLAVMGCQKGKPSESPTVAPPIVVDLGPNPESIPTVTEGCLEPPVDKGHPYANMHVTGRSVIVMAGMCSVQIGEDGDVISLFPPEGLDRETLLAGLKVSPPEALKRVSVIPDSGRPPHLQVTFHPGKPGEWLAIGWEGEGYRFGFELERLPDPRVDGFYQVGDNHFQRITDFLMLPPNQQVTLRFRGEDGITPDQAADAVRRSLGSTPATVKLLSRDSIEVTVPDPPEMLFFNFQGLRATHADVGLNGYTVYTVEPPRAVWHDPATGQETPVGAAPVDIFEGYLSPDGAHALLLGYAPESPNATRIYVMETATGQIHLTSFRDGWAGDRVFWLTDRVVLATNGRMQIWHLEEDREEIIPSQAIRWGPLSPDGRYVVGFSVDLDREDPATWLAPATIYLFDLTTGTERAFVDAVKVRVPHSSMPYKLPMAWAGGRLVLGQTEGGLPTDQPEQITPMTLDAETGNITPGEGTFPEPSSEERLAGPVGWEGTDYVLGREPGGKTLIIRWEVGGPKRFRAFE